MDHLTRTENNIIPKTVLDAKLDGKKEIWKTKTKVVGRGTDGSQNNMNQRMEKESPRPIRIDEYH